MEYPNFEYEKLALKNGFKLIAGADEVGRGCFAGPVVAAVVVFAPFKNYQLVISNLGRNLNTSINDSKKLTVLQRQEADIWIRENCTAFGIGKASAVQINNLGIKKATEIAYRKAISETNKRLRYKDTKRLINKMKPTQVSKYLNIEYLLLDAFYIPKISGLPKSCQNALIKGDSLSISIAAASIIAKVFRDKLMIKLAEKDQYKNYLWHKNKGYGTLEHRNAIRKYGITKLHREMFVQTWMSKQTL